MSPTESRLLDSSAWLGYYFGESKISRDSIESEGIVAVSVVSLFEIERKLLKLKYNEASVNDFLDFIQNRANLVGLSPGICKLAAGLSIKHELGAMDSLILACAKDNQMILLSGDKDFKGIKGVEILD